MRKSLLTLPAAAALVLAAPALAVAAPPYTVAVGGSTATADHAFTASSGPINFTTLGAFPNAMTCGSAGASGNVHAGTGKSGTAPSGQPATIANTTWNNCSEQFGTPLTVAHSGSWYLEATDTSVSTGGTDNVDGRISNIKAHVYDASGGCDFWVEGVADGHFDEANQDVVVTEDGSDGSLAVTTVSGSCLGMVAPGDPAAFSGTFSLNAGIGFVNVS